MEIPPPGLLLHVAARQQNLGHSMVILRKQLVIGVHELALAHGGGSLLGRDVLRAAGQAQLAHAHADGAGGHKDDLMPRIFQVAKDFAQRLHPADIQPPGWIGQRGGSHLHHNTHWVHLFISEK